MMPPRVLVWTLVGSVCVLGLIGLARRQMVAARQHAAAVRVLDSVTEQARELLSLRASLNEGDLGWAPDENPIADVRASLRAANLSDIRLARMSRPADRPLGSSRRGGGTGAGLAMLRTEVIVLDPLSLHELGAWLSIWRESQPRWILTQIELRASTGPDASGRYMATIQLTTVFVRGDHQERGR